MFINLTDNGAFFMCGFIGFSGYTKNNEKIINAMMERIIHRGPDDGGFFCGDGITLGFRRLSIIDLKEGAQPMKNEDGRYTIVFNGEIYNFQSIRKDLISKGHIFKTECDTEVVIHGFEEYGEKIVPMLRGMFAFAIWDSNEKSLFCARDYFGIKPFYYTTSPESGALVFGSEIKAILEHPEITPEINADALKPYLSFQYSSLEETFFRGIFKLPPAHTLTLKNGKLTKKRYWDINFEADDSRSFEDLVSELEESVKESVLLHKHSDVPVGSFLSGGVDSSYITANLMPQHTFSVGFDYDRFNETNEAMRLSEMLGIEHHAQIISADECFEAFPKIQYHMDEPQANPSSVPLWFLSKLTRQYVTVVLSGEGADEIWGGYEWYDETPLMKSYKKLPSFLRRTAASAARKLPYFKGRDFIIKSCGCPEDYFIGQAYIFSEKEALSVLNKKYSGGSSLKDITSPIYSKVRNKDELTKKQYLDLNLWLPGDILLKADKMSMAHSIELRVPYLDKVVMDHARRVPSKYRISEKGTKYALRTAANRTLPEEWATRPKKGFPVPIKMWLREDKYYNIVKEYFTSDFAAEFFRQDEIMKLLDDHKSGKANNQRKIWVIFTFLTWYREFFIDYKKKSIL